MCARRPRTGPRHHLQRRCARVRRVVQAQSATLPLLSLKKTKSRERAGQRPRARKKHAAARPGPAPPARRRPLALSLFFLLLGEGRARRALARLLALALERAVLGDELDALGQAARRALAAEKVGGKLAGAVGDGAAVFSFVLFVFWGGGVLGYRGCVEKGGGEKVSAWTRMRDEVF